MIPSAIAGDRLLEVLYGLGIVLLSFLLAKVLTQLVLPLFARLTAKTKTKLDDYIIAGIKAPLQALIITQGAFFGLSALTITDNYQKYITEGWKSVSIGMVFWGLQRLSSGVLTWYAEEVAPNTSTNWDDHLLPIVRRAINFAILALGALVVMADLGIPISPLLASLGIGGLAIALALQPTLSNFFSGTYVLSDGSIRAGDYVEIQGGPSGTITEVGWRISKMLSADNNLVTIPNSKLSDSVITNFSQPEPPVITVTPCGVSYESDLVKVERVCLEVMEELQGRLVEVDKGFAPLVRFTEFADSNVNFNLIMRGMHRSGTFVIRHELIKAIHERFAADHIAMDYPVRRLVFPDGMAGSLLDGAEKSRANSGLSGSSK